MVLSTALGVDNVPRHRDREVLFGGARQRGEHGAPDVAADSVEGGEALFGRLFSGEYHCAVVGGGLDIGCLISR